MKSKSVLHCTGRPNPPLYPLFLQNSLSNNKNDFVVGDTDTLYTVVQFEKWHRELSFEDKSGNYLGRIAWLVLINIYQHVGLIFHVFSWHLRALVINLTTISKFETRKKLQHLKNSPKKYFSCKGAISSPHSAAQLCSDQA